MPEMECLTPTTYVFKPESLEAATKPMAFVQISGKILLKSRGVKPGKGAKAKE
jgi:hypothetical protein